MPDRRSQLMVSSLAMLVKFSAGLGQ